MISVHPTSVLAVTGEWDKTATYLRAISTKAAYEMTALRIEGE